jgi:FERM central domain
MTSCSLKEFLPQSYIKVKAVEKKVFGEHRKHASLTEIEAKVAYVKTARSLSTYGVTFFLVKVIFSFLIADDWEIFTQRFQFTK